MDDLIKEILARLGEDPEREGLASTPERASKAFRFLTKGYQDDVDSLLNGAFFKVACDEMVIVKNNFLKE